ncbi:MAG: prepilin-type N-terminal cleavage/methylation domain-containing protein [Fibrobacter sp.]|nr:prepilin-type N-terminal cleavage/methylation domain-containing protein [Fibrobacter sp.]
MSTRNKAKEGFTLIELVVTMAVSGIFFMLAMHVYVSANGAFVSYKKSHEDYFEYNVKKATAEKMLRENTGECDSTGNFSFTGESADSLNEVFPFPEPKCAQLGRERHLVYFLGKLDSTTSAFYGFSATIR